MSTAISVCICTYRRPQLLQRTLAELLKQETQGRFTMMVVVADNDREQSARSTVEAFRAATSLPVTYRVEPERNIARARNAAVESAEGDYVALRSTSDDTSSNAPSTTNTQKNGLPV